METFQRGFITFVKRAITSQFMTRKWKSCHKKHKEPRRKYFSTAKKACQFILTVCISRSTDDSVAYLRWESFPRHKNPFFVHANFVSQQDYLSCKYEISFKFLGNYEPNLQCFDELFVQFNLITYQLLDVHSSRQIIDTSTTSDIFHNRKKPITTYQALENESCCFMARAEFDHFRLYE